MGDLSRLLRWSVAAAVGAGVSLVLLMPVLPGTVQTLAHRQAFLLAFLVVVVAYLCIAAGFALMGALSARAFALSPLGVCPQTGPYRFSVALGVTGGLLVIPTLLLSALGALSTNGAFAPGLRQWQPLLLLLVAGVYGLVSGTLLGFLLLRASQAWRVALAATAGAMLGGGVAMGLFHLLPVAQLIKSRVGMVALLVIGLVILHLGWSWAVGAALEGVARRWAGRPDKPNASARQVWVVATLGLLTLFGVSSTTRTVGEFMTSRPVDTSPLALPQPANLPGCPPPAPGLLRRAWDVYTSGGRPDLSCGNRVAELLDMPGSDDVQHTAFQDVGDMVVQARREVLFTTMEYSSGPQSPGRTLTDALARLYAKVKADPAAYPGGIWRPEGFGRPSSGRGSGLAGAARQLRRYLSPQPRQTARD